MDRKIIKHRKEMYSLQQNGSLTVESAIVFPCFFLFCVVLLTFMDLYRVQGIIITSLSQSAKELGMYAYCVEEDGESPLGKISEEICIAYAAGNLQKQLKEENLMGVQGGRWGINLLESTYKDGVISLKAVYRYKSPAGIFPTWPVKLSAAASARAWLGYEGIKDADDNFNKGTMVFVTEHESVYHTSLECTHLKLSVTVVEGESIGDRRNYYGHKYYACEKCVKSQNMEGLFYISEKGNRFHSSGSCSGLTRHVRLAEIEETGNLSPCNRCGKGG